MELVRHTYLDDYTSGRALKPWIRDLEVKTRLAVDFVDRGCADYDTGLLSGFGPGCV